MKKRICITGIFLFVVGVILILASVSIGNQMLNNLITKAGQSMEIDKANILLASYISNIRTVGTGIMGLGGIGIVYSIVKR